MPASSQRRICRARPVAELDDEGLDCRRSGARARRLAQDPRERFDVGLIASRQNGKNGAVEVREVFGVTVLGERIIHAGAPVQDVARVFRADTRAGGVDAGRARLSGRQMPRHQAQGYVLRFRGGGRVTFIARSRWSGRGLTGDLLVLDEAQVLTDKALGALLPTLSARPNPQVWYLGSAPDADSEVFHRVRARGRAGGDGRLAYLEFSADPEAELDDRDAWAQANPALGLRITEAWIEGERAAMSDEEFARERLSISSELETGGRVIPDETWDACLDSKSGPVGAVAFAIDVEPSRGHGAVAVAGGSGKGGTRVEIVEHRAGTDWLVARAKDLQTEWGGLVAVAAGSPAASLLLDLEAAGVQTLEVSTADHAKACGAFYDAAVQGDLRHLGQPELTVAVRGAERKFYGDSWLWARRTSLVDISPLVAATLAGVVLLAVAGWMVAPALGVAVAGAGGLAVGIVLDARGELMFGKLLARDNETVPIFDYRLVEDFGPVGGHLRRPPISGLPSHGRPVCSPPPATTRRTRSSSPVNKTASNYSPQARFPVPAVSRKADPATFRHPSLLRARGAVARPFDQRPPRPSRARHRPRGEQLLGAGRTRAAQTRPGKGPVLTEAAHDTVTGTIVGQRLSALHVHRR